MADLGPGTQRVRRHERHQQNFDLLDECELYRLRIVARHKPDAGPAEPGRVQPEKCGDANGVPLQDQAHEGGGHHGGADGNAVGQDDERVRKERDEDRCPGGLPRSPCPYHLACENAVHAP